MTIGDANKLGLIDHQSSDLMYIHYLSSEFSIPHHASIQTSISLDSTFQSPLILIIFKVYLKILLCLTLSIDVLKNQPLKR